MKVKGFIVEDGQGRELVLAYEQSSDRAAKMFALRGWQRRRLVPLQHTEQEYRQILAQVLSTLDDLYTSLRRSVGGMDQVFFDKATSETHILRPTMRMRKIV